LCRRHPVPDGGGDEDRDLVILVMTVLMARIDSTELQLRWIAWI